MSRAESVSADEHYTKNLAIATYLVAHRLMSTEGDSKQKKKMKRVLKRKRDLINETFATERLSYRKQFAELLTTDVPPSEAKTLFIDLAFSNPFSPYELKYSNKDFTEALKKVAARFDVEADTISSILKTKKDASKAHRNVDWIKILGMGAAGVVVLGIGGYALAPVIGAKLGAAAGLAGAAASAHGLALLGGGTLAAGGAGMAGGLWLVTGTSAVVGGTALSGGALLHQIGAAGARVELTKLQVTYKEVLLQNQMHVIKAQEAVKKLSSERDQLKKMLKEERDLNDKNASRVQEVEEKLKAIESSMQWMEEEAA